MNLDERDTEIVNARQAAFLARKAPKQGDVIHFSDGKYARMAHVWEDGIQPTISINSGSFYLGDGYMEYSGGLEPAIPMDKFHRTSQTMNAPAWIFHHGHVTAHNGIDVTVKCQVWECDAPAPENWHETLWLTQITPEYHQQTCNYWYLITKGGTSHAAFTTERELTAWLNQQGLKLTAALVPVGQYATQKLEKGQ